jgi:peroxiredoxin
VDGAEDAAKTQQKFAHITIIADPAESLMRAAGVLGPQKSPEGKDIASPTTVLVDRNGTVTAILRTSRYITRPTPEEILALAQKHLQE